MLRVLTCVVSYKLFWNWIGVVRFVSHEVWFDKGFEIWYFLHCCFLQIVSLWSLSIWNRHRGQRVMGGVLDSGAQRGATGHKSLGQKFLSTLAHQCSCSRPWALQHTWLAFWWGLKRRAVTENPLCRLCQTSLSVIQPCQIASFQSADVWRLVLRQTVIHWIPSHAKEQSFSLKNNLLWQHNHDAQSAMAAQSRRPMARQRLSSNTLSTHGGSPYHPRNDAQDQILQLLILAIHSFEVELFELIETLNWVYLLQSRSPGGYNTQSKSTGDWQGQGWYPVYTKHQ